MSDLPEQIEKSIGRHGFLRRDQSVLVAVSGGVDSMVLLHLLHELSPKHRWRITIAHLNHCLRGRSSMADEQLVARTARKLGLPVVVKRVEIKTLARSQKISVEMAARQARHEFLATTAARLKTRTIALAHHADDQVELFFLRLLRGSGGEGLAGMKWHNVSPANVKLALVRPLLDQPKEVLREFAREHKIPFREDASNASSDILRNRIRHELLPLLKRAYQPAVDRTVLRVMEIAGTEAELVGQLAADWLAAAPDNDKPFARLPAALQRRCLQIQLLRQKVTPSFDLVETLRMRARHWVKVSPELAVMQEGDGHLHWQAPRIIAAQDPAVCEMDLKRGERKTHYAGVDFTGRVAARRSRQLPPKRPGREYFDAAKVGPQIVLRHWRAGDRFQPSGLKSAVKLQDLFVNGKIPRDERHGLVVATTAAGEIFWVERLRIAERFKLAETTKHCLQWQWKRL